MRLRELSEKSRTTPASIKFYLREGLLPAGEKATATLSEYSSRHLERLELIQTLRQSIGLGIADIRPILQVADACGETPARRLDLLEAVQTAVLGLDSQHAMDSPAADALVERQGWPDVISGARSALNSQLNWMKSLGLDVPDHVLDTYADAVDSIAQVNIAGADNGSADQLAQFAAVGIHVYSQLLMKMLALAQASHSIRRFTDRPSGFV